MVLAKGLAERIERGRQARLQARLREQRALAAILNTLSADPEKTFTGEELRRLIEREEISITQDPGREQLEQNIHRVAGSLGLEVQTIDDAQWFNRDILLVILGGGETLTVSLEDTYDRARIESKMKAATKH